MGRVPRASDKFLKGRNRQACGRMEGGSSTLRSPRSKLCVLASKGLWIDAEERMRRSGSREAVGYDLYGFSVPSKGFAAVEAWRVSLHLTVVRSGTPSPYGATERETLRARPRLPRLRRIRRS